MPAEGVVASSTSTVQAVEAGQGAYTALFEKINLSPVTILSDIEAFQTNDALSEATPDERLSHVPAAIPLRLENQYFHLELDHVRGQTMLAEGVCAFYVPSTLVDVKLEQFAVLRT